MKLHHASPRYLHKELFFIATFIGYCKEKKKYKWIQVQKKNKSNDGWEKFERVYSKTIPAGIKEDQRYKLTASFQYKNGGIFTNINILEELRVVKTVESLLKNN